MADPHQRDTPPRRQAEGGIIQGVVAHNATCRPGSRLEIQAKASGGIPLFAALCVPNFPMKFDGRVGWLPQQ